MKKQKVTKVVVITGAGSGIGFATANYFKEKGYKVFGIALESPEKVNANFEYYQGDITNSQKIEEIFKDMNDDRYLPSAKKLEELMWFIVMLVLELAELLNLPKKQKLKNFLQLIQ